MNICLAEIWQAWRASFRKPGFLLLASGVLALGIGASVAVFALIDNTLIRPLPVPQASRLVVLGKIYEGKVSVISPHEYQYLAGMKGVASLGLMQTVPGVNIAGDGMPAQVPLTYVDRTLLPTLGLQPLLGRNFNAQEDQPNGAGAVLLSHGLWQRRFGGNRAVIGGSMQVEGRTVTIIGVLPAAFDAVVGAGAGGIVLPMALPKASRDYNHNGHVAIARLGAGTRIASVAAQTDARERAMYRDMAMGGNWKKPQFGAVSFVSFQHAHSRPMLLVFLASALFVLLIALVNLTNLMLLRALSRNHDAAVRSALGAPLLRLILPALAEGLLVGFGGALLGMLLAVSGLAMLQQFIPAEWMQGGQLQVGASAWLLAFGAGLLGALLAAVLGLWRSRSATAVDELREGGRSGMGTHSGRLGRVLVVTQVALAVTLLCAAGGIAHAIFDAANRPIGFVSDNILTFELAPVKATYPDAVSMQQLSQRLLQRLRAIPGVSGATVTTNLPTSDGPFGQFNNAVQSPEGKQLQVQYHGVGPDFFSLFGIALRDGRGFTRDDVRGGEPVAIVSQNLADTLYDGHAMGKLIQVWSDDNFKHPARIVGVVDDTFQLGPLQPTFPVLYVPLAQMPDSLRAIVRELEPLRFALRGHGNPADWRAGLSAAVAEVAPGQPIASVRSMHSIVRKTTADARLSMLLIGLFATLSLLLAAAGMYAVMAVAVAAREREFGVRTALGASPARLVRMVLRGGLSQI
ncbi:MAG TPA: ABC transporter permease, partial [Rhodanobacter sp.]|nr:ABC transporter permease [Rhodanobacter sp.]